MHLSREQHAQESGPEHCQQIEGKGGKASGGNRETRRGRKGNPEVHTCIQYKKKMRTV